MSMVMPASGTFDYVAIVPEAAADGVFECATQSREQIPITGDELSDGRLVGLGPRLTVSDAGLPPEAGGAPGGMRRRFTLTADSQDRATVAEASFHVDRVLARRMLPGDVVHIGRTACAGLGLSIVRKGELVAAVGAVTAIPLGHSVGARFPRDLIDDAAAIFRRRDPKFEFSEWPIEIVVDGDSLIIFNGGGEVRGYAVSVRHGFISGDPGSDVCAAIWRTDLCPAVAARASAELMDTVREDPLSMVSW
jgi:hypothetical protein